MEKAISTYVPLPATYVPYPAASWLRLVVRVFAAGCCLAFFSWSGLLFSRVAPDEAVIWLANGALLAFLLASPRVEWPWYLAINIVANTLVHLAFHYTAEASMLFSIINTVEVVLAAVLLMQKAKGLPDLSRPATLAWFGLCCVLVAPAVSALLAGSVAPILGHVLPVSYMRNWFIEDALGIAVMTPLVLGIRSSQIREIIVERRWLEPLALLSVLMASATAIFSQSSYPLLFLIFPLLFVITFRLGRSGSGIAIILLSIPAIHFTLLSRGPFALTRFTTLASQIMLLQVFFFTLVLMMYGATAILSERKRLGNELRESEERYRMLADHSWDILVRSDLEGVRSYLSPSVFDVVGWTPEELVGRPSAELIHPADLMHHKQMLRELTTNNAKLVYTYRMKTKDGGYLWVETKARLVTDPATGQPREVVSVIRDVSARVAEQQQLMLDYRQAQVLARIDTLTGLANRRGFDDAMQTEWRRAIRDGSYISLLMVDVDNFKSYNDDFGHQAGDACLQAIGEALARSLQRASDIAARYGGEEFAILLPNTPAAGAREIADRIRYAIAELHLDGNGRVARESTISIGLAALQPKRDGEQDELLTTADRALYTAKRNGRNQVVVWWGNNVVELSAAEEPEAGAEPGSKSDGEAPEK